MLDEYMDYLYRASDSITSFFDTIKGLIMDRVHK